MQQQTRSPERIFVKWATPSEEAVETMRLAYALVQRRVSTPERIVVAAPNRVWAANLLRAAQSVEVPASLCIVQQETDGVRAVLDKLEEAGASGLKGRSLAHRAGADAVPELAHGLEHLQGDEDAVQLGALLRAQLAGPTVASQTTCIPIMLAADLRSDVDYLFLVGCVNGLLPSAEVLGMRDEQQRENALAACRSVYQEAMNAGKVRTTASCFSKAPAQLAERMRLPVARTKTENGEVLAICTPSMFVTEEGQERPSTTGGQALLRTFGLN